MSYTMGIYRCGSCRAVRTVQPGDLVGKCPDCGADLMEWICYVLGGTLLKRDRLQSTGNAAVQRELDARQKEIDGLKKVIADQQKIIKEMRLRDDDLEEQNARLRGAWNASRGGEEMRLYLCRECMRVVTVSTWEEDARCGCGSRGWYDFEDPMPVKDNSYWEAQYRLGMASRDATIERLESEKKELGEMVALRDGALKAAQDEEKKLGDRIFRHELEESRLNAELAKTDRNLWAVNALNMEKIKTTDLNNALNEALDDRAELRKQVDRKDEELARMKKVLHDCRDTLNTWGLAYP